MTVMTTSGPCYQCEIRHGGQHDQQIVMCSLHAAAPDLLKALEALVTMYPYASDTYAPWTTARAAIVKAKGDKSGIRTCYPGQDTTSG